MGPSDSHITHRHPTPGHPSLSPTTLAPPQPSVAPRTNPLIDRILANPLTFKPAKSKAPSASDSALHAKKGFIVLAALTPSGAKQSHPHPHTSHTSPETPGAMAGTVSPRKPKSMAEAVAAYTGKKFLTRKEKRLEKLKIKQQLELQRKEVALQHHLKSHKTDGDDIGEVIGENDPVDENDNEDEDEDMGSEALTDASLPFAKFDSESSVQISSRSTSPERRVSHVGDKNEDGKDDGYLQKAETPVSAGKRLAATPDSETEGEVSDDDVGSDDGAADNDEDDDDDDEDDDDEDEDEDYAVSASDDEDDEEDSSAESDPTSSASALSRSASGSPQPEGSRKRAKIGFEDDDLDIKSLRNDLKLDRYENGQDNRALSKSATPEASTKANGNQEQDDDDDDDDDDGPSPIDDSKKMGTTPPTSPEEDNEGEKHRTGASERNEKDSSSSSSSSSSSLAQQAQQQQQVVKKKTEDTSLEQFYDLNQNPNDHGSNGSTRIIKHWREYSDRKPWGLLNEGVTCYMNSAIQAFVHIPAMQHYLNQIYTGKIGKEHKDKANVTYTLAELSNSMWSPKLRVKQRPYIYPKRMIQRLHQINCMMSQWQQEDSHEYFMSLMSRLQEDLTPKGHKLNESIIYDIFGGLLNQKITCLKCQGVSETKQEFYDLSLGLNKKKSHPYLLEKSLTDFFSNELIKTDKKDKLTGYYCSKCEMNTNANKISTIDISPEYLTIHLKRFKFDGNSLSKLKQSISYPNYLDLTKFQTQSQTLEETQTPAEPLLLKYRLMSVIVHEGRNVTSGHYVAHCLQPDGTWATYDDEYINKIAQEQALSDPAAYVLVYGKLTAKGYKNPGLKREGSVVANGAATKKRKH